MVSVFGQFSLLVQGLGESSESFEMRAPFEGNVDKNGFSGSFALEGETSYLSFAIHVNGLLKLQSFGPESRSEMLFDTISNTGEYNLQSPAGNVSFQNELKLVSYEYNNTHFVIQYSRIFQGHEEAHYRLEVTFNVTN